MPAGFGPAAATSPTGGAAASAAELAQALQRVAELEAQCAELRDTAARKDQVLSKSRKFIESYLSRSSVPRVQQQAEGAAVGAGAGAAGAGAEADE